MCGVLQMPLPGQFKMNKSLEAFLRGYVIFKVNDKRFYLYNTAVEYLESLPKDTAAEFAGLHVIKGYRCFYLRLTFEQGPTLAEPEFEEAFLAEFSSGEIRELMLKYGMGEDSRSKVLTRACQYELT